MRIQHNIMAMSAYRNYTNNVAAMKKNLEKLSSGYKINRAGDDAAGLAISEKMRAQITGLETAQKNAKDGISLVQTAEGALTEVHDMLNRMVELATQSANGTYDIDTDRAQMQKELDQLRSEIDRIADSSNFNGIKLLDGSMDPDATIGATEAVEGTVSTFVTSTVGQTLGTNTIKHEGGGTVKGTQFGVDLHEVAFENKAGQTLELTIGSEKFTLAGGAHGTTSTALKAKDIVDAFVAGEFKKADGSAMTVGEATVGGTDFTVTANGGTGIKFVMKTGGTPIQGDMAVTVAGKAPGVPNTSGATLSNTPTAGTATKAAVYEYDFNGITGLTAGNYTVDIAGQTVNVTLTGTPDAAALAAAVQAKLTAPADGLGTNTKYTVANTGTKITFTASGNGTGATGITGDIAIRASTDLGVSGDYNKTTTITDSGQAAGNRRIASAVATLDAGTFADGTVIRIGDKDYTVSTKEADKNDTTKVYVGDLDVSTADGLKKAIDRLTVRAASNSVWTVGHGTQAGKVTFTEKVDATNKSYTELKTGSDGKLVDGAFDLTKESGIKESLGVVTGAKAASAGEKGKKLTLQIGDTADKYNKLEVGIKDMHVKAMGKALDADGNVDTSVANGGLSINDIKISTQEEAAKAVDVIKRAINYVSDVRGTLGATQNRLDHTMNNLSVMTENIQDAESTIRDVDVAEEMMAYTKNNILIQSAQAMLAQANQVPQGVLQLLQ